MAKKTCPNGHIYDTGIYGDECPFCVTQNNVGGKTVISGAIGAVQDSAVQATPKFCPQCGKPLTAGVKFCANCGTAIVSGTGAGGSVSGTNGGTMVSGTEDSGFSGETQIGSGAKTVIYGHTPESEHEARAPQVEAAAAQAESATQIVAPQVVQGSNATVVAAVETAHEQAAPQKKLGKNAWMIAAGVIAVVGVVVAVLSNLNLDKPLVENDKPLVENENGNVIFTSIKNNNSYIGDLAIDKKQLTQFIQLGKKKDPNTEAFDDYPDDYRIELFQKVLNNGEVLDGVYIYLAGIPSMAGYSTVYGWFHENDKDGIFDFNISFDNEYLDKSGIEFRVFVGWTDSDDSLAISKYRYTDTNEIYYAIDWKKDLTKKQKLEILNSFFNKLRYSNVYNDPKFDKKWFSEIYTGIEKNQQIGDLFDENGSMISIVYEVGDIGPAGGIIFYDKGNDSGGWRYLEAAKSDLDAPWGPKNVLIGGTKTALGTGKENTKILSAEFNKLGLTGTAAQLCDSYVQGGFTDWFMPSKDELEKLSNQLDSIELSFENERLCSSSEINANIVWGLFLFLNGSVNGSDWVPKGWPTIPIRSF
ncbi:MAG: hypothetical protein Ta2B_12180 [Termitinemataceae bacterium]|nr:MAG: hypothetical protein Ta2B_12180 [Termitinemataceae bacterium]